jgi:hypothetical protein
LTVHIGDDVDRQIVDAGNAVSVVRSWAQPESLRNTQAHLKSGTFGLFCRSADCHILISRAKAFAGVCAMETKSGQSIVEMALLLPVMLMVLFGIIEFGYLIFAYSMVSQAARNGAEAAAQLPPYQTWLDLRNNPPANYPGFTADPCTRGIMEAIRSDIVLFDGTANEGRRIEDYVTIRYPNGSQTRNLSDRGPIEIEINYPVRSITPLFDMIGLPNGTLNLRVVQRRSIENLGVDPTRPRGVACARDINDWNQNFRQP